MACLLPPRNTSSMMAGCMHMLHGTPPGRNSTHGAQCITGLRRFIPQAAAGPGNGQGRARLGLAGP